MENCTICLENIIPVELIAVTECQHTYHRTCLITWLVENNTCPLCRSIMDLVPTHGVMVHVLEPPASFVPTSPLIFTIGVIISRRSESSRRRNIIYHSFTQPDTLGEN